MGSTQDNEYYKIVDLFPTGKDRFDINNIAENSDYLRLCNRIGPGNWEDLKVFIFDCTKFATYIKDLNTKCPIKNKTHCCKYLNYSINDVVKSNSKNKYTEQQLINSYNKLAEEFKECTNSIKSIEDSVFKKVKELSNIYYEFNKYINTVNTYQTNDCQDLPHSVKLYLNKENTCKGDADIFCAAVDTFKNYYLSKIKQVKCKNAEYNLESYLTLDHKKTVTSEEEGREGSDVKAGKERSADELGSRPVESQRLQAVHEERPESRPNPKMLKIAEDGLHGEDTTDPGIGDPTESIMSKNVSTIGSTFVGSSLFLVMMYKYTPLGSWVSTKILGRNKLMENMEKNYELLLNDVGNREESLKDPMYHIRYNSAAK